MSARASLPDPDLPGLLRRLAAGEELAAAARACGFANSAAAAAELQRLAASTARGRVRERGAARGQTETPLLPRPPRVSPYPRGGRAIAHADGASRGNPGPAAYGCVYLADDGTPLCGEGAAIGIATNNVAEYRGAKAVLERLLGWGVRRALLRLDSQLVVRQLEGSYRVKDAHLQKLHAELGPLMARFHSLELEHVPRGQNALADREANRALDAQRR